MAIQWFYQTGGGQPSGPVDFKELRRLAEAGIVRPDTLVRLPPEGDSARWVRAEQVRGLFQQSDSSASRAGAARPGSAARREFTPLSPPPPPPPLENAPAFDPYYVWLGIRPSDRPLSHYRLLGIADFEDNAAVISNAADRQKAHVRAFQSGEHAGACEKILNELSAARVCLLNLAKKAFYDGTLQRSRSAIPQPVPRLSASQVQQEAELARRRVADRDRERESPPNASPEEPDGVHPFTWAAVIVGAGTVLLLLWALVFRGGSEPQQQADRDRPPLAAAQSGESEDSAPAPVPQ